MSERTSFAKVAQAVVAVDQLQLQMAKVTALVEDLVKRVEALEATVSARE